MHNASRSEHANFLRAAQGCCDDIKIRLGLRVALGGGGFCRSRGCRQVRIRHGCGRMCRRWQCRHSRSLRRRPRERARVRNIKPEETPRSQIDVFAKGLKRHRNGLHRQLRASVLRRAGPQSGQYCSPELLLRPECSQDVVWAI